MKKDGLFDFLSSALVVIIGLLIGFVILLISDQVTSVLFPILIFSGLLIGFTTLLINYEKKTGPRLLPILIFTVLSISFIILLISNRVVPLNFTILLSTGLLVGFTTSLISHTKKAIPKLVLILILVGLSIGFIRLLISNSEQASSAFLTMIIAGFSSMRNLGDVLFRAAPIILTGLSVAFAFKTGLFNIGASGQFTMGAFVAIYIGVEFTSVPPMPRILLAVVAAALLGALWGAIPGLLKAYRNVHEVISSIMTNYIGMFLVNFLIMSGLTIRIFGVRILNINSIFDQGRGTTTRLPENSALPSWGLENIFTDGEWTSNINIGIFIAILVAILVYIILEKTTFGYELKACGFNKDAAKYAGINEKRNIVLSMMISGALAGLAGAVYYLVGTGASMGAVDSLAPQGFTGISVAFLGLSHPLAIIFSGTLVSYLFFGGDRIQVLGFSIEIVEIVISIVIYFCAFVSLVKVFLLGKNSKFAEPKEESQ